ncbi:MAG: conserved hypothetical protein [Methanobrevibacter sp. CfCl-M3]
MALQKKPKGGELSIREKNENIKELQVRETPSKDPMQCIKTVFKYWSHTINNHPRNQYR